MSACEKAEEAGSLGFLCFGVSFTLQTQAGSVTKPWSPAHGFNAKNQAWRPVFGVVRPWTWKANLLYPRPETLHSLNRGPKPRTFPPWLSPQIFPSRLVSVWRVGLLAWGSQRTPPAKSKGQPWICLLSFAESSCSRRWPPGGVEQFLLGRVLVASLKCSTGSFLPSSYNGKMHWGQGYHFCISFLYRHTHNDFVISKFSLTQGLKQVIPG